MITIGEILGDEDKYNWWLTIMPDIMLNLALLPKSVRSELDYSVRSLDAIEKFIIENYNIEEITQYSNKGVFDLFSRYVGETFRKNLTNIIWCIETREAWFGYPLLCKRNKMDYPKINPASLVVTVLDRKSGDYLSNILKFNIEEEIKWNTSMPE